MVDALFLEYLESTFAALPVGARREDFFPTDERLLTNEEIKLVFPVPAYPLRRKILRVLIEVTNSETSCTIFSCSLVKENWKLDFIFSGRLFLFKIARIPQFIYFLYSHHKDLEFQFLPNIQLYLVS